MNIYYECIECGKSLDLEDLEYKRKDIGYFRCPKCGCLHFSIRKIVRETEISRSKQEEQLSRMKFKDFMEKVNNKRR